MTLCNMSTLDLDMTDSFIKTVSILIGKLTVLILLVSIARLTMSNILFRSGPPRDIEGERIRDDGVEYALREFSFSVLIGCQISVKIPI